MRGKTPTNFVKPNCIMQLADSVSVAKIKIIYASTQRAHSEPGAKKAYIAGLGRDQLEHLASPMTKSETSPSPNTNESKTSPRR